MRSIIKVDMGSWEVGKLGWFRSSSFGWGVDVGWRGRGEVGSGGMGKGRMILVCHGGTYW